MKIYIEVNGHTLTVTLADNEAAKALAELLKDEPMVLDLNEYGSFEKVGALPQSIPKNDERSIDIQTKKPHVKCIGCSIDSSLA